MISELLFALSLALLTHTYVLYPLIAAAIDSRRKLDEEGEPVPVSVLVPAHNEESVIEAKVNNFLSLNYPPELIELVIADDGSTDGTSDVIAGLLGKLPPSRVRCLNRSERMGKAATMNRLVESANHRFLLFTDANVMLEPDAVHHLVRRLQDPEIGAVTGEVRLIGSDRGIRAGESTYYWLERRIQNAESRIGSVMGVDGGMYLLRRSLFQKLAPDTILDDFRGFDACGSKRSPSGL